MNRLLKCCSQAALVAATMILASLTWAHTATDQELATTAKLLQAQSNCPAKPEGTTQLFRLYHSARKNHFYTADPAERDSAAGAGYTYEGTVGYIHTQQVDNTTPLYRLYHPNNVDHFYTIDEQERQKALDLGFNYEEITGYVYEDSSDLDCWLTPLYRMFKGGLANDHFYTTDSVERAKAAMQDGYSFERNEGYLVIDPEALQAQKNPVIIVGGTLALEPIYWILEARLQGDGYYRRFFPLPKGGTIDINESAKALNTVVETVLRDTGADKVHLIGHSQGSTVARTYIANHNAYSKVDTMISLGGPHKGTTFTETFGAKLLGCPKAPPCEQMSVGSSLLQRINNRPANDPVYYTNFVTDNDIFVTPRENGFMDNCDRTNEIGESLACNIHVQASCPHRFLEHIGLASDATVYSGIRLALEHRPIILNCKAF